MNSTWSLFWKVALAICGIFIILGIGRTSIALAAETSASTPAGAGQAEGSTGISFLAPSNAAQAKTLEMVEQPSVKAVPSVDKKKPTVRILQPKKNSRVFVDSVLLGGTARDNIGVVSVWWRVNGGIYQQASGTVEWSATVPLLPGANKIEVYSRDAADNVSMTASVSLVCLKDLLITYWPMNNGDEKVYSGILGDTTVTFSPNGSQGFEMYLDNVDESGNSASMYYELNGDSTQLLLASLSVLGYSFDFYPPLIQLDATLLDKGGSKKSSCVVTYAGMDIPVELTVSVKNAGTITVPAGTYQNCKRLTDGIKARVPGYGTVSVSADDFILAPRVGAIKLGVYTASGARPRLVGYQDLVSGTVNGVPVGDLAIAAARSTNSTVGSFSSPPIQTHETAIPNLQVETPLAVLEYTRYGAGGSRLVLRGRPGCAYLIEAGTRNGSGEQQWVPIWEGNLVEGSLSLPVPDFGANVTYRVREL